MIEASWSEIKRIADSKNLPLQWVQAGSNYYIALVDGPFVLSCLLPIGVSDADTTAFEATYKISGNKRVDIVAPAFASKTSGTKRLYSRNTGFQSTLSAGTNTISYTASLAWAKITGVQIVNCAALDSADFKVYDTSSGTYSGIPNYLLNQFAFSVNLPNGFYDRESPFDADIYAGMILRIEYISGSAKTVGFNLIMSEVK